MKDQEAVPGGRPGADELPRERAVHLGVGADSALERMKQWERSRAELREAEGDSSLSLAPD